MPQEKRYARALTIAGSDSGGGAGIQADLKTFSANGCYGMSVITALTAQNTLGVRSVFAVPAAMVSEQMEAVLSDIGADAIKIGMLFSPELIRTVAEGLRQWASAVPVVLDPVMVAQSGDPLLKEEAVAALKEELIPLARLITPNLPEAAALLGRAIPTKAAMEEATRELATLGSSNVLVKGGHLEEEGSSDDLLYLGAEQRLIHLPGERIPTRNNHGTGCTLSSAIAAGLARGLGLSEAVAHGKAYITAAIRAGAEYRLGGGHGPVHHFHAFF